jgi:hypothetical protein
MSGIYILKTKDGYRISHNNEYDSLVSFDSNAEYFIVGEVARRLFSNSFRYDTLEEAYAHARVISKTYIETDDGICVVKYAENLTFKELIKNGKNN